MSDEVPYGRPVHFDVHAENPGRAQAFYEQLLGWRFAKWGGDALDYWLITTGETGQGGINGGMVRRMGPNPPAQEPTPVVGWVNTVAVDDVDAKVARALELGGVVALPKMAIPGRGWLAYVKDTESNIFGMMQNDEQAR